MTEWYHLTPSKELTDVMRASAPGHDIEVRTGKHTTEDLEYLIVAARHTGMDFTHYAVSLVTGSPFGALGDLLKILRDKSWEESAVYK